MYYYAYFEDQTGPFNSMGMIHDNFNESSVYLNSTVYPVAYGSAQEVHLEKNFKFFSDIVQNGDSTSIWVTRKNHTTDTTIKMYKVWYGTSAGASTANFTLSVPGAVSAKRYTQRYDSYLPDSATLTISGQGTVSIPVNEAMTWVIVTQVPGGGSSNQAPSVSAGSNQTIQLPTNSISITASATDGDGTIATYAWTKISGTGGTITNGSTATATFSSLSAGTYVFRVTVTDDDGAQVYDDVAISVQSQSTGFQVNCNIINPETALRVYRMMYYDPAAKLQYRLTMYKCGAWIRQRWIGGKWVMIPY
jgi:hypothetical protein